MSDNPLYQIRPLASDDLPFIYNSWLKSYRDSATVAGVPNTVYYAEQHKLIERLIASGVGYVACNSDDPAQIFGYIVAEPRPDSTVLHWVYVKHPFRSHGIARALVEKVVGPGPVYFTHRVKQVERVLKTRNYIYNPYLLGA